MAIPEQIRNFVVTQLDYYIREVGTCLQIAERYSDGDALENATFGVILGRVHLGFVQAYQTQLLSPNSEDIAEFHDIVSGKEKEIISAIRAWRRVHLA